MNRVCLTGRLTRDPELRQLGSGQDVVNIRIAVDNGRDREPTYIDIAQFGKGAAPVAQHLSRAATSRSTAASTTTSGRPKAAPSAPATR